MEKSIFTPEYRAFLQLLRETRKRQGLTQEQLAKRLGETQSWVSKCERAEHRLDIVEVWRFCQALEVSLADLATELDADLRALQR